MQDPKVFIGPMTKNVVKAANKLSATFPLGFIPSRRQIDWDGGYVGYLDVAHLSSEINPNIPIERDHGGPMQGASIDDGLISFTEDAIVCQGIHIDPWKLHQDYAEGVKATVNLLKFCHEINDNLWFEVGTEEAIRPFSLAEFDSMVHWLKYSLGPIWKRIKYLVVQSGVGLDLPNQRNTGTFDAGRLKAQLSITNYRGKLSKEHNGDYLSAADIQKRFDMGLSAINIAPEIGQYETEALLELMDAAQREEFFQLCLQSTYWQKWVNKDFNPHEEKMKLMLTAGHYVVNELDFDLPVIEIIEQKLRTRLEGIYA